MARVSRGERARRSAISRGLRAYWREVHAIADALDATATDARAILRAQREELEELVEEELERAELVRELVPPPAPPPPPRVPRPPVTDALAILGLKPGEYVFYLKDVMEELGLDWSRVRLTCPSGQVRVTVLVEEFAGRPGERRKVDDWQESFTFDLGRDDDDAWSAYFAAARSLPSYTKPSDPNISFSILAMTCL